MSSLIIYRNITAQIEERQKRLTYLRQLIQHLEEAGKPIEIAKRNLRNLMAEIRQLQNKIQQGYHLKRSF